MCANHNEIHPDIFSANSQSLNSLKCIEHRFVLKQQPINFFVEWGGKCNDGFFVVLLVFPA
jgi:hypothetical protein